MNWIDSLLAATDEAETPRSYIYWAGIATVSAIIGPNVWINRKGVYKLSPNLFIILIGESGLGKGLPINVSKKLVKMVGTTRVISGNNTIQSIIKDLGATETDEKTGIPKFKDSRGYIVSGEFSTLVQEDKLALPTITELYDTHYSEDWEKRTKSSGYDKLDNVNLTLFGASTPEHFQNVVPEADIKGGFVGRILTVYEEDRWRINPLTDTSTENKFPYDQLCEHLKLIGMMKGPFEYADTQTKILWEEWYTDIRNRKIHDPTGAVNRLPDNVLKVAMCIALANRPELKIYKEDLEESIGKCMSLTIDSRRLTEGKGKSPLGEQTHLVIRLLFRAEGNQLLKSHLLERNYGQFDLFELDRIIATLEAAGMVQSLNSDKGPIIMMIPETAKNIKRFMER